MKIFQYVVIPLLGFLALSEWVRVWRGRQAWFVGLMRSTVWVLAVVTVAFPEITQWVANLFGIGRGTDVVLYLFVLCFLGSTFYLYSRTSRLQQQVTKLVRDKAIREAVHHK